MKVRFYYHQFAERRLICGSDRDWLPETCLLEARHPRRPQLGLDLAALGPWGLGAWAASWTKRLVAAPTPTMQPQLPGLPLPSLPGRIRFLIVPDLRHVRITNEKPFPSMPSCLACLNARNRARSSVLRR